VRGFSGSLSSMSNTCWNCAIKTCSTGGSIGVGCAVGSFSPVSGDALSEPELSDSGCLAVTNGEIAGSLLSSVSGISSLSCEVDASL
jgi:hypothetical protein